MFRKFLNRIGYFYIGFSIAMSIVLILISAYFIGIVGVITSIIILIAVILQDRKENKHD
jgi:hypothetical protein